jgi:hypothetical protein
MKKSPGTPKGTPKKDRMFSLPHLDTKSTTDWSQRSVVRLLVAQVRPLELLLAPRSLPPRSTSRLRPKTSFTGVLGRLQGQLWIPGNSGFAGLLASSWTSGHEPVLYNG